MILIIGGRFSGRHSLAGSLFNQNDIYEISQKDAYDFQQENLIPELSRICEKLSSYPAVIATETGCGIVPLSKEDREFRENNGRLNCALAKIASKVIFMSCGLPREIKVSENSNFSCNKNNFMLIFRHGQTDANFNKRFAGGITDIPLNDEGIKQAENSRSKLKDFFNDYQIKVKEQILNPKKIFVSPMKRAIQTAQILFPDAELQIEEDLREMKMGLFENMTHEELSQGIFADGSKSSSNAEIYQKWLDSNGQMCCPSSETFTGESIKSFEKRTCSAFRKILSSTNDLPVIVAHGGVQMSLCNEFFSQKKGIPYFSWQTENAMYRFGEIPRNNP